MNDYMIAFQAMGAARDNALAVIAGLCLVSVLCYGMLGLYKKIGLVNEYWQNIGRAIIVSAVLCVYCVSWFWFA